MKTKKNFVQAIAFVLTIVLVNCSAPIKIVTNQDETTDL